MSCSICLKENKTKPVAYSDCIIDGLEKIKVHYLSIKGELLEKDLKIQELLGTVSEQEKSINSLQKHLEDFKRSPRKRRKPHLSINNNNSSIHEDVDVEDSSKIFGDGNVLAEMSTDDLNMALNSENHFDNIFDCSAAQLATPPSKTEDTIAETENTCSPRVFKTIDDHSKYKRLGIKMEKNNNENKKLGSVVASSSTSGWIFKEKDTKKPSINISFDNKCDMSFVKPIVKQENTKKVSLSLRSGQNKLKQTRLQLDVSRKSPSLLSTSTFCDDIIAASPMVHTTPKKSKSGRQWLLRNGKSYINRSNSDITNLTLNKRSESGIEVSSPKPIALRSEFVLRNDPSPEKKTKQESIVQVQDPSMNTSSVMILTPATQDIVFLDDSCDNSLIASMDLLNDLMKSDGSQLANLRRLETQRIRHLQKPSIDQSTKETDKRKNASKQQKEMLKTATRDNGSNPGAKLETLVQKNEKSTLFHDKEIDKHQNNIFNSSRKGIKLASNNVNLLNVKMEKTVASTEQTPPFTDSSDDNEREHNHVVLNQNCIIKKEQLSEGNSSPGADDKARRIFNIDCHDCQMYIKYIGANLTDREIEQHIRNCTKHKNRDAEINLTPSGFWNPFIEPFDKDDPRNETLIDTRFIGKPRRK